MIPEQTGLQPVQNTSYILAYSHIYKKTWAGCGNIFLFLKLSQMGMLENEILAGQGRK